MTKDNKKEEVTFSPAERAKYLYEKKYGPLEKNKKTARATKRSQKKANGMTSKGKYQVKIVDGIKYMVLK
jgi:hypothetical protein